jgi:3D (Asp-Asp-Asp) domain-containing protein
MTVIILISFSTVPAKRPVEQTALNYKAQPIKPKILAYSDSAPIVEPEIEWLEFEATPVVEPEIEWLEFEATAYCPCEKCCGKWAKNRPNGIVYTASGEIAEEGITIAADWSVLPKGTVVEIDGVGTRIVQDKGGAIKGNRIDIYFLSHQEALEYGRQTVQLREVGN